MSIRSRTGVALLILSLAIFQACFVYSPVVIPWEHPGWMAVSIVVAVVFWWVVFVPGSLPVLVPHSWPRLQRAVLLLCGLLLTVLAVAVGAYGLLHPLPNQFVLCAGVALGLGGYYLVVFFRQEAPRSVLPFVERSRHA